MVDKKLVARFLKTDEAQKIKELGANMGMQLSGLMVTAFEKWVADEVRQDPCRAVIESVRNE